jgi:hypothetical protein
MGIYAIVPRLTMRGSKRGAVARPFTYCRAKTTEIEKLCPPSDDNGARVKRVAALADVLNLDPFHC